MLAFFTHLLAQKLLESQLSTDHGDHNIGTVSRTVPLNSWSHRKSIADAIRDIDAESAAPTLRRVLGPLDLMLVGIGVIVGAGIFVVTGNAAAQFAGPAIVLSFLLAGLGCALTGVCYAELAAMIPAAGSAYAYIYTALGEAAAWIVGWSLLAEYVFGASYVSVGWSGYLVSLFAQWGVPLPPALTTAPLAIGPHGLTATGSLINAPASLLAIVISLVAMRGVRLSSIVNGIIVSLKMGALILLVTFGALHVHPHNWTPFLPPNAGMGHFGWSGVVRAAAVVFVSYLGFDAIATLAQDTRNPQRNVPIGILGSLGAVTLLYIAVSLVLTGLVSYTLLDKANPLSVALRGGGPSLAWLLPIVDLAAVIGLGSVVLIVMLAQPRVLMAMGKDGLVPQAFARVHARFHTPYWGTIICGVSVAALAGLFPISILVQLVSVGTLIVFFAVAASVIVLRGVDPGRPRPFRTPWVPAVPIGGMLICLGLLIYVPGLTWAVYLIWLALGLAIYWLYGSRSAVRLRAAVAPAAS
jgi:APA family basic amino acid/polyamine antiporter